MHLRRVGEHVPVQYRARRGHDLLHDRVRAQVSNERKRHVELPFLERKDSETGSQEREMLEREKFRPDRRQIRGRGTVRDQVQRERYRESGRVEGYSQVEVGHDEGDCRSA